MKISTILLNETSKTIGKPTLKGTISQSHSLAKRLGPAAEIKIKKSTLKGMDPTIHKELLLSVKAVRTDLNNAIKVLCQSRIDPEFNHHEK